MRTSAPCSPSASRHEESLAAAQEGLALGRLHGLTHHIGGCLRPTMCEDLWVLGQWGEVESHLQMIGAAGVPGLEQWRAATLVGRMARGPR